jgi:hypothetical protein
MRSGSLTWEVVETGALGGEWATRIEGQFKLSGDFDDIGAILN